MTPPGTCPALRRPMPVARIGRWPSMSGTSPTARAGHRLHRPRDGDRDWPSDADYDDGNFDTYNERRREPWASMPSDEILRRLEDARGRMLPVAHRLTAETIREEPAWSWVYPALHGHYLDHLLVIEPWTDELRRRAAGRADDPA